MNSGIIGTIVYAYKHKDYGDIFLCLRDFYLNETNQQYTYFETTDKAFEAINNYHENHDKFEKMFADLQEDYVYEVLTKEYTDEEGYTGVIKKSVPLQIKDFVKVAFESNYNQVVED